MSAAAAEMELDRVECRRTTTTTTNNNNKRSTSKKQTHSPRPTTSSVSSSSPDRHHRAIHETRAANATTTRKRGLFPRLKGAILQKTTGSHNPRRRSESVITSTTFHAITGTANENDETDSLGDHILALLIQREAELYQAASSSNRHIARNNNNCHNHNIFRWKPILSHHNWTVLCHKLYHLQQQLLQLQQARGDDDQNTNKQWNISGAFFECIQRLASMAVNQHRPNLVWSTLLFLLRAAVVALLAVALGGTALLLGGGVVLVRGGSCICSILVDWDALLAHSKVASRLWRLLQDSGRTCYSFLDSVVLQGYRYQGREWNRGEFLFQHKINPNGSAAVSSFSTQLNRNASLWDLPPPSSISLSTAKTALSWSSRSRQHIEAIEYCYSMLQQEAMHHQQQQTRKDTRKNSIIGKNIKQQQHHQHALLAPFAKHKGCRRGSTDLVTHTKQTAWNDTQSDVLLSNKRDRFVENDDSDDNEGDVLSRGSGEGVVDDGDMDWIDVGTKIGMRFLHSEQIHRAMASKETKERLLESMTKIDGSSFNESNHSPDITDSVTEETVAHESTINLSKPVHSMWSSPVAAAADISTLSAQDVAGQLLEEFPSPFIEASQKQNSQLNVSPKLGCTSILSQTGNADSFVSTSELDLANDVAERVASLRPQLCDKANTNKVTAEIPSHRSRADLGSVFRRTPLQPGVKVAIPISPLQPCKGISNRRTSYQMASVIRSSRVYICEENEVNHNLRLETNCLSVTVKLEKFFLRNGEFGELTFRVMDAWSQRYMPRHSKVPIGSCIATSYGIGVLVGWRVEDDCHVVRSLWHCRGPGSAHSFLNRDAIHSTSAAALGFRVQTMFGWGVVLACVNGGMTFENCRFFVEIREDGRHKGNVLELEQKEILSCHGAQFLPVTEHIRAAAQYQIEVDNYVAAWREQLLNEGAPTVEQEFLYTWSSWADILWQGFLKAIEEDKDFDDGMNAFITSIINFLDRLDRIDDENNPEDVAAVRNVSMECADGIEVQLETDPTLNCDKNQEPGFWIMNDLFGGVFKANDEMREHHGVESSKSIEETHMISEENKSYFDRAFAVLRILMKTVSIARASSVKHPHFRLALAVFYDFLLFLRTIVKIQQRNTSIHSLKVWKRAWEEITSTFGPIKDRLESLGRGIARRMEQQGRKAKVRVLKFADKILGDERLLFALEQAEWDKCLARLEIALVEADIIEEPNLFYYRKAAKFLYDHAQMALGVDGGAATRSTEKLAIFAYLVQSMASPRRSFLKVFCRDDVLECFERILVRAYYKEEVATRMLTIHAANFQTLRHLRILKDFSVSGRIWIPLLDAADEELSWLVSTLPENSKGIMCPLSSLFSLCVAQFHKINAGDYSRDWLSFLLEDDSVRIIQDIDMLLTLALEAFSRDIREMMTVLPYYPSIDDDILNLMDEVNLDEFLKEASDAIDDPDNLSKFIREKATIAIERFLNYLPKMSIPVEKRELSDGWVLSCHGEDGGGLTLTDVTITRENLVCQIMGGVTLFFPMFAENEPENATRILVPKLDAEIMDIEKTNVELEEESVLDHIKLLITNAQQHGCWKVGVGGVCQPPTDRYAASVFQGVPVSTVLNCSIDLWRNLEIDDDELLEIAIRDISYHIQLQQDNEKRMGDGEKPVEDESSATTSSESESSSSMQQKEPFPGNDRLRHRFNPRVDPTVLFLEIKRLTLNLDNFYFRIEKGEKKTIFDPVFAGRGILSLQNVSIRLRVECAKERVKKPELGIDISTPILQLRDLEVGLDKLQMTVTDTGFGSDWILNKAVEVFEDKLTEIVEANLKDQIQEQAQNVIENLNSYFLMNPSLLLNLIGISMDDLNENVVWV